MNRSTGKFFVLMAAALFVMLTGVSCSRVKLAPEFSRLPLTGITEKERTLSLALPSGNVLLKADSSRIETGGAAIVMPDLLRRSEKGVWQLPARSVDTVLAALADNDRPVVRRILIDPGHGGSDPGALCVIDKVAEKNLNLDMALKLGAALEKRNFQVIFTRNDDVALPLEKRAGHAPADLFISVHHNAAVKRESAGFECFVLLTDDASRFPTIRQSVKIALQLQRHQSRVSGNPGRGVKFANFKVLRDAGCPALLIECGFLTNPDEAAKLLSDSYRQLMAEALAAAIAQTVSL